MHTSKSIIVVLVLLALCLIASLPLVRSGMFQTHDYVHGVRIAEMARSLREGHFPVIWSAHFGYGKGMPLFEFYAPLPYYLGALLYLSGLPLLLASKLLFFIPTIVTAAAGYAAGKRIYGRTGGLLMATALVLTPYRALNMYVRGAVSELWGMAAVAVIMWAVLLVLDRKRQSLLILSLSVAALLLSHNLTSLIAAPFIGIWSLAVYALLRQPKKTQSFGEYFIRLVSSGLVGGCLATFYMLPALVEKKFTIMEESIIGGYFDFKLHFLYIRQFFSPGWGFEGSNWGPDDGISFFLGFGQLLALLVISVGLVAAGFSALRYRKLHGEAIRKPAYMLTLLVLIAVAAFLTLQRSLPVWEQISFLSYIQFPWRYLSITSILCAVAAGAVVLFNVPPVLKRITVFVLLIALMSNAIYFRAEKFYDTPISHYYDDPERVASQMSDILPDYIPVGLQIDAAKAVTEAFCAPEPCQSIEIQVNRGHEKRYLARSRFATNLVAPVAWYPGWQAWLGSQFTRTEITQDGFVSVAIPSGETEVAIALKPTPVRQAANAVSAVSALGIASAFLITSTRKDIHESEKN